MKTKKHFLKPIIATISMVMLTLTVKATNVYDDVIVTSPDHTVLEAAIIAANLESTLRTQPGLTVFAPTDAAFTVLLSELNITAAQLLADPNLDQILLYHVLTSEALSTDLDNGTYANTFNGDSVFVSVYGDNVFIDQALVTAANLTADNGVVHVLDDVILEQNSIIDVAVTNGFSILTLAVITAELVPALIDPMSELTVFAPTDAAFSELLADWNISDSELLANPNLQSILLYHVIGEELMANELMNGNVTTLNTEYVTISIDNSVMINDSEVILADVLADNGIVHVIDAVLLPESLGVDTEDNIALSIYPNPATEFISITFTDSDIIEYNIYDAQGKIINSNAISTNNLNIDLTQFDGGTYFIEFIGESSKTTRQFIIKK